MPHQICRQLVIATLLLTIPVASSSESLAELRAGAAKVDIADPAAGKPHGDIYARALVIGDEKTTLVLVAVDAVAIGGIGSIRDEYLGAVRERMSKELGLDLTNCSSTRVTVTRRSPPTWRSGPLPRSSRRTSGVCRSGSAPESVVKSGSWRTAA